MTELEYWQQKLIQLLHDPPGKTFFLRPGAGGHKSVSAKLLEAASGVPLRYVRPAPDHAAAGADRPVCSPPSRTGGTSPIQVDWIKRPLVTHPLASGEKEPTAIDLGTLERPGGSTQAGPVAEQVRALAAAVTRTLREAAQPHAATEDDIASLPAEARERHAAEELAPLAALPLWKDADRLKETCVRLWRRLPESVPPGVAEVIWQQQPADSRAPDHNLWDHLKVASALAFLVERRHEGAAMPWLVAFSLGPVQRFIAQSRTSSDLWTTSMLLSDLIWQAMVPFVERYGPESIVYPDLRGNPRADQWLREQQDRGRWKDVLPTTPAGRPLNPCSYAGIFPNTFVALVPRGGDGALDRLQDVAEAARTAVQDRWKGLASLARSHFLEQASKRKRAMTADERAAFDATWERQHRDVLFTAWSAAAWPNIERVRDARALAHGDEEPPAPGAALSVEDVRAAQEWRARHAPWIPKDAFSRYSKARYVYALTNLPMHQSQRGFDYPLIHHALYTRHALRKAEAHGAAITDEVGEKCTLCGLRQALGATGGGGSIDTQREEVRRFWSDFDRNSDGGAERLCAVCTMKRVLVRAGTRKENGVTHEAGLTAAWAGPATPMNEVLDRDGELRVPFPSTATLAAQAYLRDVVQDKDLRDAVAEVVRRCEAARLPRTSFVRSLRSLAEAACATDDTGRRFLEYEAELTAFPEVVAAAEARAPGAARERTSEGETFRGALRDRDGEPVPQEKVTALREAVERLRREARDLGIPAPGTQIAAIAIDGDNIRKVLLGTDVRARWRDVIHPHAVALMEANDATTKAGWPELLDQTRLMGPSTHAFVNRVLASFAHTLVPWVVERELDGRLIYAGGDDVLALAPAAQALDIAARLAQLYRAAWVLDTRPDEAPWDWRRKDAVLRRDPSAADRFVAVAPGLPDQPVPWPIPIEYRRPSVAAPDREAAASDVERLLPMMGAGQTLSAGIAIGHYKTPLGSLVRAAWDERDRAKGKREEARGGEGITRRNAFSIRRYTRGGEKTRLRLAWGGRDAGPSAAFAGYERARKVIEGFRTGAIAGRLPYKLREVEDAVLAVWWDGIRPLRAAKRDDVQARAEREGLLEKARQLAEGLFRTQAAGCPTEAFEIWWEGLLGGFLELELRWEESASLAGANSGKGRPREEAPARGIGSEQGLAVCRFLGTLGHGEEDAR